MALMWTHWHRSEGGRGCPVAGRCWIWGTRDPLACTQGLAQSCYLGTYSGACCYFLRLLQGKKGR